METNTVISIKCKLCDAELIAYYQAKWYQCNKCCVSFNLPQYSVYMSDDLNNIEQEVYILSITEKSSLLLEYDFIKNQIKIINSNINCNARTIIIPETKFTPEEVIKKYHQYQLFM